MRRLGDRVTAFLFPEESDRWLSVLRFGLGCDVILRCLLLRKDWSRMFSASGEVIIGRELPEAMVAVESRLIPTLQWLINAAARLGLDEQTTLHLIWFASLAAGCSLAAGFFSRTSAVIAWFLHLATVKSGGLLSYGVDNFMTIGLFYLMLTPLPDRRSLDWRLWQPEARSPQLLGFSRRVLQVHLCVIYFFSGLAKSLGSGWWDGSNIWRALTRPPFNILPPEIIAGWKYILPLAGISICVIELGYPFLIWLKQTRTLWLSLVCAMHAGIGLMMGMHLFALVMIILNLAAFAPLRPIVRLSAGEARDDPAGDLLSARR
jgi:hypothetical protein